MQPKRQTCPIELVKGLGIAKHVGGINVEPATVIVLFDLFVHKILCNI